MDNVSLEIVQHFHYSCNIFISVRKILIYNILYLKFIPLMSVDLIDCLSKLQHDYRINLRFYKIERYH